MEKIYEWITEHKVWTAMICIGAFASPLIIVHILYKLHPGIPWLISDWGSGDVLAYIAGFEALLGTVLLGALTLWQNERFKEENDKSQERLQKISEEQAKALVQILLIDKSTNIPLIDFQKSPDGDEYINIYFVRSKDGEVDLWLYLTNITEYPMKDIHVQSLELFTYGLKYTVREDKDFYNPHKGLPGHYNTHVAFKLWPVRCTDKNEHFEKACPGRKSGNTLQEDAKEWAQNNQFILEVNFEIKNIYERIIREKIMYEFRITHKNENSLRPLFWMWNKELTFNIVEETDNA